MVQPLQKIQSRGSSNVPRGRTLICGGARIYVDVLLLSGQVLRGVSICKTRDHAVVQLNVVTIRGTVECPRPGMTFDARRSHTENVRTHGICVPLHEGRIETLNDLYTHVLHIAYRTK